MPLDGHDIACLRRGLDHFRAGDYFAAHDDWEEVWQGLRGRPRLFWQAMIQCTVGAYHYGNGNQRGCRGQWHKALEKCHTLAEADSVPAPVVCLHQVLHAALTALEHNSDPLPLIEAFATETVTEQWFTVA